MTCPRTIAWSRRTALCAAVVAGLVRAETTPTNLPDLQGPEFTAVGESYAAARSEAEAPKKNRLVTLTQRYLADAEQMLSDKKKTRNTTGMAVAAGAIDIFRSALTNLEATGTFTPPAKVRRELEPLLSEFGLAVQRVEADYTNRHEQIFRTHLDRFTTLIYRARPELTSSLDKAALARQFRDFLARKPEAPVPTPSATNASGIVAGAGSTNTIAQAPSPPEIIATSGQAAQWVVVGQWTAAMAGLDVISISLPEMTPGTNRTREFSPRTGGDSLVEYVCVQPLTPKPNMLFRLKRIGNKQGVDVLEWPSARNGGTLLVRVPASRESPSLHGFELQAAAPGEDLAALFAGAAIESDQAVVKALPPLWISVITTPPGASVSVDGSPVPAVRTPCRLPIPRGLHTIGLDLPGHIPATLTNQNFTTDKTLRWTFRWDPRAVRKSFAVSATAERWVPDGTRVNKGDLISIEAEGTWSCGPGKELCDATGYPNSKDFHRYYQDAETHRRQLTEANFGALLVRIGADGPPLLAGKSSRIPAPTNGPLYFDINEGTGNRFRQDNAGTLILRLLVAPPSPASPSPSPSP